MHFAARRVLSAEPMIVGIAMGTEAISPVFEVSNELLTVELKGGEELRRQTIPWRETAPLDRVDILRRLGVETLICGSVSLPVELWIRSAGIKVISRIYGPAEDALAKFKAGELE